MAASPPTNMSMKNTEEEINSTVNSDGCSATENGNEQTEKDISKTGSEDPFKKPALFTAPSVNKRSNVAVPSKNSPAETGNVDDQNKTRVEDTTGDVSSSSDNREGESSEKACEEDENGETDKADPPLKPKLEVKPKVRPFIGPAAGKFPPIPYTEPPWGCTQSELPYALEILKNGAIVDTVPLTDRSYFVVGRLPVCDVALEHPSISRYHAVIQYRGQTGQSGPEGCTGEERGFYVHDLGSTHGTVVNKNKIPPKTYIRLRVGHVLKFGGSTRLFVLQGPEFDEEEESELSVTELRERARKQKAELERKMMGDFSDEEKEEAGEGEDTKAQKKRSSADSGCTWGMDEDAAPEEDENEENPFSTEFQEDQEAAYLKDPKKALQGFYDREGEELEFEYEDKSHGAWLCRIKLPVDDAQGRQLVAEVTHTGKKKEAAVQCCLEACRMLEARGVLRQEAVSRKRRKKNWEDEDYYDSDDDTFLDRTGTVEKKRQERMKKAGKIEERPETYESLVGRLSGVEKELAAAQAKLSAGKRDSSGSSAEDSLDAFMTAVRSEAAMDAVQRRKLHVHVADLRREAQRLRRLVELTRPAQMPSLQPSGSSESEKPKKTLPLFGAMKGGKKLKLKTGTIGTLPPKRPNLPAELFNMKALPGGEEEEEEEEEEEDAAEKKEGDGGGEDTTELKPGSEECDASTSRKNTDLGGLEDRSEGPKVEEVQQVSVPRNKSAAHRGPEPAAEGGKEPAAGPQKKKRVMGPSRPPVQLSAQYPEDDPDYSVWLPPAGQTGDGRTHLNDKYGY
ncbi:kanadaptin [Menidia menidia]